MKIIIILLFCFSLSSSIFIKLELNKSRCFFEDFYSEAIFNFEYEIFDDNLDKNVLLNQSDSPLFKLEIKNTQVFDPNNTTDNNDKHITLEAKKKIGKLSTVLEDLYFAEYCIHTDNKEIFDKKEMLVNFRVYSTSTIIYGGKNNDIAEEKHLEASNSIISEIDAHSKELNNIQAVIFENERNFKDINNEDNYFMIYITSLQLLVISAFGFIQLYYIYKMVCYNV